MSTGARSPAKPAPAWPAPALQFSTLLGATQPNGPPTGAMPPPAPTSYDVTAVLTSVPATTVDPCAATPCVSNSEPLSKSAASLTRRARAQTSVSAACDVTQPERPGCRLSLPDDGSRSSAPIVLPR